MLAEIAPAVAAERSPDDRLRLHVLGPGEATLAGAPVIFRGHPRMWPLLAFLALNNGRAVEREALASAMWPDARATAARGNLRRHLSYLGEALGEGNGDSLFVRSGTKIGLAPDRVWVDALAFIDASSDDTRLLEAKALYAGSLLEGYDDEWIVPEREQLRDRYVHVLDRLVSIERKSRNATAALAYARQALQADPFREDMVRAMMRLRFESGDRAGALSEFERFSRTLHDELDAEPAAETTRLADALRENEPATPELRSLPVEYTSFVGRSADLAALAQAMQQSRLVTVVGPPGVGKTRFAVRLAHISERSFADGARFVDLSTATKADDVERTLAEAFEQRSLPRETKPIPVERRLRDKNVLIVLDNCEQVSRACAVLADRIIRTAPRITIIATSRTPLKARSEAVFALAPLGLEDARRLFVERARFARRELTLEMIERIPFEPIVQATDGLPLALELCAARLRTASIAQLTTELRRPFALAGGLRTSFEAGYLLLDERERRLLRRLAIFAGPIGVAAAHAAVSDEATEADTADVLCRLVDHSLMVPPGVDADDHLYAMLQSIRDFAREKCADSENMAALALQHARYFADRFIAQDADLRGPRAHEFFDIVAAEHDELRTALKCLIIDGAEPERGARLALAISRFWFDRGYVREGANWLEAAAGTEVLRVDLRAQVLHVWATLIRNQGDYRHAFVLFGDALAAIKQCGDARSIGKAYATYANAARMAQEFAVAELAARDAVATFAPLGDRYLDAHAQMTSGCVAFSRGALPTARSFFQHSLTLYRGVDAEADVALVLGNLGAVAYYERDYEIAGQLCAEAAERARAVANGYYEANALLMLARVLITRGDVVNASASLKAALALAQPIGDKELLVGVLEVAAMQILDTDAERAATLLGCVDVASERYRIPQAPPEAAERGQLYARLGAALSANAFAAGLAAGGALSLEKGLERAARYAF